MSLRRSIVLRINLCRITCTVGGCESAVCSGVGAEFTQLETHIHNIMEINCNYHSCILKWPLYLLLRMTVHRLQKKIDSKSSSEVCKMLGCLKCKGTRIAFLFANALLMSTKFNTFWMTVAGGNLHLWS